MSTKDLMKRTTGRNLRTAPRALIMASAVIWSLAGGTITVGQQASQSTATATQNSASQTAVAKTKEEARDSNAKADSAAVDKSQNKTSRRSDAAPSPLLTSKEHQFHPVQIREYLDRWLADGLVRAREASNGVPAPDLSLTLSDAAWGAGDRASAALLEVSELRIPTVSITFPISKRTDGKTPQPAATLSIGPRVEWEAARSIVEVFARHGISTKVDRRPTLSLWFVSSSFSSPDEEEMKALVDELGLKVHKEHPLQLRTEVLFPQNAAAIYEPQRAAQLLKWLKVRKLVFEEVPGDEQSPWRVTRSPVGVEQDNGLVRRTSTWSWQASTHMSPSLQPGIEVQRGLTVTEDWRGKGDQGNPATAYTSFSAPIEPGKVAILHAFPIFDGQNDPMFAAVPAAHRRENYIAILIVQNYKVEQSARELLTDSDEPKLLPPDAGAPLRLFPGPQFGKAFAADFQVPSRLVDVRSRLIELHNLPRTSNPETSSADDSQKFSLQFKSAPWPEILDALSRKAGLTLELRSTPPGTLGLEDSSLYSPTEAIDRLNEQLVGKGHILIQRDRSLICVSFEKEPVARDLVPSVSLDDLPRRGRYELLSITVPVSEENKKQIAEDLDRLKGPAGSVVQLASENAIVVTDLGMNLRQIAKTVPAVSTASNKRYLEVYQLKSANPRETAKTLDAIMPGVVVNEDSDTKRLHVMGTTKQHEQVRQQLAQLDSSRRPAEGNGVAPAATFVSSHQFKVIKLYNASAGPMAGLLAQVIRTTGFAAVADDRTNSVIITSPDDDTAILAEAVLAKLDSEKTPVDEANPFARRAQSSERNAKPLAELQKSYAEHEAAAAKQARDLREFVSKRRPGLSDKDFAQEEKNRREQLAAAVRESFAARQAMLAAELEALKSKIAETQQNLEVRNRAADQIVARRLEDLLNPQLQWEDAAQSTAAAAATLPSTVKSSTAAGGAYGGAGQLFQRRPTEATGSGAGQFGPGKSPPKGSRTIESNASYGRSGVVDPNAIDPLAFPKQPRMILLEGLDGLEARKMITEIGWSGDVTVSSLPGGRVDLRFDATDDEYQSLRPRFEEAAARARQQKHEQEQAKQLAQLTGIWDLVPTSVALDAGGIAKLVMHGELAATFEGNQRKRIWSMKSDQSGRYTFTALDGQSSMQGTQDANHDQLTLVSIGQNGAQITVYTRAVAVVPPEWVAEMEKGIPARPAGRRYRLPLDATGLEGEFDPLLTRPVSKEELERFTQTGRIPPRSREPLDGSRNPSDYLELVQWHAETLTQRDRLQQQLGATHPEMRQRAAEFDRAAKAIEILKKQYQADVDAAAGQVELRRAELSAAKVKLESTKSLYEKKVVSRSELQLEELALQKAETQLQTAESRLKLFQSTKDELFPPTGSTQAPASPTPPQAPAAVPATPAAPKATAVPAQPATPGVAPPPSAAPAPAPGDGTHLM